MLRLNEIRTDGGTQSRAMNSPGVIDDYAAAMREGATFPPVTAFFDGEAYWLADGFHRVLAALSVGLEGIDADVRQGTRRDAVLYACGANSVHGLRRTNEDKNRAVRTLLEDGEWSLMSDREIARYVGVSPDFVSRLHRNLTVIEGQSDQQLRRGADGRTTNTSNIGRTKSQGSASSHSQRPTPPPEPIVYRCETCGERFDDPVWECSDCGNHWPEGETNCRNCAVQQPLPVSVLPTVEGFLVAIRDCLSASERRDLVRLLGKE